MPASIHTTTKSQVFLNFQHIDWSPAQLALSSLILLPAQPASSFISTCLYCDDCSGTYDTWIDLNQNADVRREKERMIVSRLGAYLRDVGKIVNREAGSGCNWKDTKVARIRRGAALSLKRTCGSYDSDLRQKEQTLMPRKVIGFDARNSDCLDLGFEILGVNRAFLTTVYKS